MKPFFFNNLFTDHSRISLSPRRSACEQKAEVVFEAKWTFIFKTCENLVRKISTMKRYILFAIIIKTSRKRRRPDAKEQITEIALKANSHSKSLHNFFLSFSSQFSPKPNMSFCSQMIVLSI